MCSNREKEVVKVLCYYVGKVWLSWGFKPLQSCCTEQWSSSSSCLTVSCFGEESYVTCGNATLRSNIISALAASSLSYVGNSSCCKSTPLCGYHENCACYLCVNLCRGFLSPFLWTNICNFTSSIKERVICSLKFAHSPFGGCFFPYSFALL